jgi:hypothetical protein
LALTSHANTITWDEPDHIYSGYMSWKGDFGLNPEHPPLVKFIATLPFRAQMAAAIFSLFLLVIAFLTTREM